MPRTASYRTGRLRMAAYAYETMWPAAARIDQAGVKRRGRTHAHNHTHAHTHTRTHARLTHRHRLPQDDQRLERLERRVDRTGADHHRPRVDAEPAARPEAEPRHARGPARGAGRGEELRELVDEDGDGRAPHPVRRDEDAPAHQVQHVALVRPDRLHTEVQLRTEERRKLGHAAAVPAQASVPHVAEAASVGARQPEVVIHVAHPVSEVRVRVRRG